MTWRPTPQPPCEPGCTCGLPADPPLPVVIREPELRECGTTGCTSCDEVYRWIENDPDPAPPPGGGDRVWRAGDGHPLPDADESSYPPNPVDLPGAAKNPAPEREPGGASNQRTPESGTR